MEVINVNGVAGNSLAQPIVKQYETQLAAYLARARGPGDSSLNIVYPPRPSGEAARVVWQEYDLPIDPAANVPASFIQNDGNNWTLGTPSRLIPGYSNHDTVLDYNHNIWFTSSLTNYYGHGRQGRHQDGCREVLQVARDAGHRSGQPRHHPRCQGHPMVQRRQRTGSFGSLD
jgi:hypothetical protein